MTMSVEMLDPDDSGEEKYPILNISDLLNNPKFIEDNKYWLYFR